MRDIVVSEWVTLDGVFDADTMEHWFTPYDSVARPSTSERESSRAMPSSSDG